MAGMVRYAVYWAPEPGTALARFGAAWLGWDAERGSPLPHPALPGLPRPVEEITAQPRRYGFHATLKAPFRLAAGMEAGTLAAAVADLAREVAPFTLPPLRLAPLGRYLALVPSAPCPALDAAAAACVTRLDGFRAPMPAAERARRAPGLTPAEAAHLDAWGYPYVLDTFRFHLTLAGPLDPETQAGTAAALAPVLAPILEERHPFRSLCLFGEDAAGPFRILHRMPLGA
jgi:putative phosphonate metabolism protein